MTPQVPTPPPWARWLLARLHPEDTLEEVEGDLEELYAYWYRRGKRRAALRYLLGVLSVLPPLVRRRKHKEEYDRPPFFLHPSMFRNHFKIALRSLWKNRLFSAINLFGMSVGIGCVVVLILFAQKCLTWDAFHQNGDRLYYIQTESNGQKYSSTVFPLVRQLLKDYPEIETGTHVQSWYSPWIHYQDKNIQESTFFVDSSFFQVFSFALKYGDPATAFKDRNAVVLSERVARSLFGDLDPVGKVVTLDDTLQFNVTGVLDKVPANSSQQFEVLMRTEVLAHLPEFKESADWYNTFSNAFMVLKEGTRSEALEAKLSTLVKTHFPPESQHVQLHLKPYRNYIHDRNPTFKGLIYGAIAIALFLLVIISINFINLNVAAAIPRLKEVAVRRVVGANKGSILRQFWMETGIIMLISVLLALLCAIYYLIPAFNQLRDGNMQLDISLAHDYPTLLTVLGVTFTVALIAGTYPAYYLLGLKITEAVKGKLSNGPYRGRLRQNSLIVVQFTLAVVLIVETIGMRQQLQFMKTAELGYNKNQVLVFKTDLAYRDETVALSEGRVILDELRQNPNVVSFCASELTPVQYWHNFNTYFPEGAEAQKIRLRHVSAPAGYFETYRIPLVEGRGFSDTSADSANHSVVINEAARKAFGWTTAVGKQLRQNNDPQVYTVIGVTKDFHYQNLSERVEPLLHWYSGKQQLSSFLTVRLVDESKGPTLIHNLEARFKKIPARRSLGYFYLKDEVAKAYRPFDSIWQMASFVTLIAILTACAGIFGLISMVTKQRTKEIGIRKVLGATARSIAMLLSGSFLKLVLLALLLGLPLSFWLGQKLLHTFAYRVEIEWWYFLLASALALGIALLTVSFQSIRAALMNPVKSLRNE
ncbi:ABC transporter permease [Rhabdobacter roseus]|uniref:Putative ABC transport system permease protein n=1 Tax=Rhabdobacter roseus TaxID=1655419 RepID=A0A840TDE0_9BACT|nr:ABC transporter permease [Rhabdobacter roseus]MBB5282116.1 putative ABC transport system permease protein [Rhabdobacter roseus]